MPNVTSFGDRALKEVIRYNEVIERSPNPIRLASLSEEEGEHSAL